MTEYIEREKLLLALKECQNTLIETYGENDAYVRCLESVFIGIERAPAADVRPVVVCADCEHNNHCLTQEFVDDCGKMPLDRNTFFCADAKAAPPIIPEEEENRDAE